MHTKFRHPVKSSNIVNVRIGSAQLSLRLAPLAFTDPDMARRSQRADGGRSGRRKTGVSGCKKMQREAGGAGVVEGLAIQAAKGLNLAVGRRRREGNCVVDRELADAE
jgi:hypothetical protein